MYKSKRDSQRVYVGGDDSEKRLLEAVKLAAGRNEEYLPVEDDDSIYEIDVKCFLESKK